MFFNLLFILSGDIFIHCLANFRAPMEDPPSISEGCGGRVTDYRINVSWTSLLCSFLDSDMQFNISHCYFVMKRAL